MMTSLNMYITLPKFYEEKLRKKTQTICHYGEISFSPCWLSVY